MKPLDRDALEMIVVHCSATKPSQPLIGVKDIRQWHVAAPNNFDDIGYHYVITRFGWVETGRDLKHQGAHTKGNNNSVGICLVGGVNEEGEPDFNFTMPQMERLESLTQKLQTIVFNKELKIVGHRDLAEGRACPCFDVSQYFEGRKFHAQSKLA